MAEHITELLARAADGDRVAEALVYEQVYAELRRRAHEHLRGEHGLQTLDSVGLVHEVYLRLKEDWPVGVESRDHFYNVAAVVMRRIIVDYARKRRAKKRGGDVAKQSLERLGSVAAAMPAEEILAVDRALDTLEGLDPRKYKIVTYRYFAGYTQQEIGRLLDLTVRQVQREWYLAKDWLRARL